MKYIYGLVILMSYPTYGDLVTLTDLSLEATQYVHGRHNAVFEKPHQEKFGLNLNMGLRASDWLYNRSKVSSATDDRQFRYIALESELGLHAGQFDIYVNHKSQHLMDAEYSDGFRDDNRVGIRLNLYKENK